MKVISLFVYFLGAASLFVLSWIGFNLFQGVNLATRIDGYQHKDYSKNTTFKQLFVPNAQGEVVVKEEKINQYINQRIKLTQNAFKFLQFQKIWVNLLPGLVEVYIERKYSDKSLFNKGKNYTLCYRFSLATKWVEQDSRVEFNFEQIGGAIGTMNVSNVIISILTQRQINLILSSFQQDLEKVKKKVRKSLVIHNGRLVLN